MDDPYRLIFRLTGWLFFVPLAMAVLLGSMLFLTLPPLVFAVWAIVPMAACTAIAALLCHSLCKAVMRWQRPWIAYLGATLAASIAVAWGAAALTSLMQQGLGVAVIALLIPAAIAAALAWAFGEEGLLLRETKRRGK